MLEYRAQFEGRPENVSIARREVIAFISRWFSDAELYNVEVSVGEALANAAEHGCRFGGKIDIRVHAVGEDLAIEVRDSGFGFDRWTASDRLRPLDNAVRGFGLFIMRELMDEVRYSEHGRVIRLLKRFPAADAANEVDDEEAAIAS
jgi:serine/threonine-protein kinase RsbW